MEAPLPPLHPRNGPPARERRTRQRRIRGRRRGPLDPDWGRLSQVGRSVPQGTSLGLWPQPSRRMQQDTALSRIE